MTVSLFDIFKIGIGPSSSHTVGPMKAARAFVGELAESGRLGSALRVTVELYGSLALTGPGHGTVSAVILGLAGAEPETVDPDEGARLVARVRGSRSLALAGGRGIRFDPGEDIVLRASETLPHHVNGLRFTAGDADGGTLASAVYYSVGGGFVVAEAELAAMTDGEDGAPALPYPFRRATELLDLGRRHGLSFAEMTLANECALRPEAEVKAGIRRIWNVMRGCIERGLRADGCLPGPLGIPRRAPTLYRNLVDGEGGILPSLDPLDRVNIYAIAVNEENAAGGRVVTAPTNGAAGIIPAVLSFFVGACDGEEADGVETFLLTAAAIGSLYKENASISGAEMGCQGEVGVACSMAAAGLAAALGGTNAQVENAAEIGMEHNLGLTCDPVGGLVQIPCIERNAMGAVKAINAANIALKGDGSHVVPLDTVIETMRQTGIDMQSKYKETAEGGLAVNVVNC